MSVSVVCLCVRACVRACLRARVCVCVCVVGEVVIHLISPTISISKISNMEDVSMYLYLLARRARITVADLGLYYRVLVTPFEC